MSHKTGHTSREKNCSIWLGARRLDARDMPFPQRFAAESEEFGGAAAGRLGENAKSLD